MTIKLDHTIVHARDKRASATFMAEILGLPEPVPFGPFLGVRTGNEVTLDFLETDEPIIVEHYAFLVTEGEFDEIFGRIRARGLDWFADPARRQRNRINTHDGGRGLYFEDPCGHVLEIITRAYGSGADS